MCCLCIRGEKANEAKYHLLASLIYKPYKMSGFDGEWHICKVANLLKEPTKTCNGWTWSMCHGHPCGSPHVPQSSFFIKKRKILLCEIYFYTNEINNLYLFKIILLLIIFLKK